MIHLLALLAGLAGLVMAMLWFYQPKTGAQTVPGNVPIPRHIVLHNAAGYSNLVWTADADSVASRWYNYMGRWPTVL